jgi:subtilisin-like proprotein convertase family protein
MATKLLSLKLTRDTGLVGGINTDGITFNGQIDVLGLDPSESWEYRTSSTGPWLTGVGSSFILGEGVYATGAIQVRRILAGNQPSTEVFTYPSQITVDTTLPVDVTLSLTQDSGSSASDFITNNGVIRVEGLEPGATWQYSLNNNPRWTLGQGSTFTLSDGVYAKGAVRVRQYDVAGNVQKTVTTLEQITVDTKAPTGGSIALEQDTGNPNDGVTTNGKILVTDLEVGATWEYSIDGGVNWTQGVGNSFTLGLGKYAKDALQVRQTDVAGNQQTRQFATNGSEINVIADGLHLIPGFAPIRPERGWCD